MKHYRITIPLPPQGKGRGRAFRVGNSIRVMTPEKTRCYEGAIAHFAYEKHGQLMLEGALSVRIFAVFQRPKALCKVYKRTGQPKHPTSFLWAHKTRIDADNIAKAVLDALNGVLFVVDRQVSRLEVHKVIADMEKIDGEWKAPPPRVEVQIGEYLPPFVSSYDPPRWVSTAPENVKVVHRDA